MPYVLWSILFAVYLMPVAILANLYAHRDWCWNLGFPGWIKTFGLDFLQNPLLPPFWFLRWLIVLCLASPLLYWIVRKTGGWGLGAFYIVAVLKTMDDASRIVVEPMEVGFVSLRHFLLPARHCVEDVIVRRCAGMGKTHSSVCGTGVSRGQAGILCGRWIRVG